MELFHTRASLAGLGGICITFDGVSLSDALVLRAALVSSGLIEAVT